MNSPSTKITFPCSSTSVHRSRGSDAALAANDRRLLNMVEPPPNSSWLGRSSGFKGFAPFLAELPQRRSCHVGVSSSVSSHLNHFRAPGVVLKEHLEAPTWFLVRSCRSSGSRLRKEASRVAVRRPQVVARDFDGFFVGGFDPRIFRQSAGTAIASGVAPWLQLTKALLDCERRNRRRLREGTGDRRA